MINFVTWKWKKTNLKSISVKETDWVWNVKERQWKKNIIKQNTQKPYREQTEERHGSTEIGWLDVSFALWLFSLFCISILFRVFCRFVCFSRES